MIKLVNILIILVAAKAIIGFHFPWEKCSCCGKRLDKNHVRQQDMTSKSLNKSVDNILEKWDKEDKKLLKELLRLERDS